MTRLLFLPLAAVCALSAGCGDDETEGDNKKSDSSAEVNAQSAQATAVLAIDATNIALSGDGQGAAFALAAVGTSALGIITPGTPAGQSQGIGTGSQALNAGTCECDETSCTFTDCGDESGAGFILNGTISWTDTSLECDITYSSSQSGQSYSFSQDCDLTFTDTSIDGTLGTNGSLSTDANGQMVSSEWDTSMTFNDVQHANGCPQSGSVDVSATITVNGQGYSGSGSVDFDGSGC